MNLNPQVHLEQDGEVFWQGPLAMLFEQNEALDMEDAANILRDLTAHGRAVVGGGAAAELHIVLIDGQEGSEHG